jgi:hypothetical protein
LDSEQIQSRGHASFTRQLSGGGSSQPRVVQTGPFGYYSFSDLSVGQTYEVTVTSGRLTFANPSLVVNLNNDALKEDFIANDQ